MKNLKFWAIALIAVSTLNSCLFFDDDPWKIRFDDCVRNHENLIFSITLPEIGYVAISGSGEVYGDNVFEENDINLRISGSGDIRLEGKTKKFDLDISGSGDYHAFDLEAEKGDIKISGSGSAEVFVNDHLDVRITGSGDIYYLGNPNLDVNITGSG